MEEKKISSKKVYECPILDLYEDQVEVPNGNIAQRVYVKHKGAACILPITKEGKIILTKQYRYPVGKIMIEIPAGKKDEITESGIDCAKRELEEETGYQSDHFEHLYDIHNCIGYSDEMIEVFIAYDCYKVENPLTQDEDEFVENMIVSVEEAKDLLSSKLLTDVKTIVALQAYFMKLNEGK